MIELKVTGMSCNHCVKAVTAAIQQQVTGAQVSIDLAAGRVNIANLEPEPALLGRLKAAVQSAGYAVE